jgi:hypothetical protein
MIAPTLTESHMLVRTIGELKRAIANCPDDVAIAFCGTPVEHYILGLQLSDGWGYTTDQPECGELVNAFFHAESMWVKDEPGPVELTLLDDVPYLIEGLEQTFAQRNI